uniref:GPI ethanolamine phosphate transferase 1 n=1 Tax=Soboliphyme baturini TaxID=241478 RepID=A0A183ICV5_9BILA
MTIDYQLLRDNDQPLDDKQQKKSSSVFIDPFLRLLSSRNSQCAPKGGDSFRSMNLELHRRIVRQYGFVVLGIVTHLVLLTAVFEIYYQSPIVSGMTPHGNSSYAPASRLFLFVADGLRAESFFAPDTNGSCRTPFLRQVLQRPYYLVKMAASGSWGVSHTRMPTESRPGHVAMISGFYEDVSAVTKGWKENPVQFDSVFNESRFTWAWGSPDILPMFAKGASRSHVFTFSYSHRQQDFATNGSVLDSWVFDRVQEFLTNSSADEVLTEQLHQNQVVFFLHLLGIDTVGHGFKPHSAEYLNNIAFLDDRIAKLYKMVESYFSDGRTAYLFTSDHGMTDWGSHGAGDDHETMTPIVAWGAGISQMRSENGQLWNVTKSDRADINQASYGRARRQLIFWSSTVKKRSHFVNLLRSYCCSLHRVDIAPLMAALIGVNFPLNSVGSLPVRYVNASVKQKAMMSCSNFYQVLEQFKMKKSMKRATSFKMFFSEFNKLTSRKLDLLLSQIRSLFQQKRFSIAGKICLDWIPIAIEGVMFYHQYERPFFSSCICCCFLLWQCCVFIFLSNRTQSRETATLPSGCPAWYYALGTVFIVLMWLQSFPLMHYVYSLLPYWLLGIVLTDVGNWRRFLVYVNHFRTVNRLSLLAAGLCLMYLEVMVISFFSRWVLTVGLLMMVLWLMPNAQVTARLKVAWVGLCAVNSLFTFLPAIGTTRSYDLVVSCLDDRRPTPSLVRAGSWVILVASGLIPTFSGTTLIPRLFLIALSLFLPFSLMSVNYEPMFYVAYALLLFVWLCIERELDGQSTPLDMVSLTDCKKVHDQHFTFSQMRRAAFYVFFLLLGFFGTGNLASINSFDPSSFLIFISVFNPFVMAALVLVKVMIPVLLATCALCGLHAVVVCDIEMIYWLIVGISDFLTLHFFFLLRDSGSWLDIGISISHFLMSMVIILIFILKFEEQATHPVHLRWTKDNKDKLKNNDGSRIKNTAKS